MKCRYTTKDGRLTVEFDADHGKIAFEAVARIQEVFEESSCGCCGSEDIRCDVREYDGNKYYKLMCAKCGAQLDFGQHKNGRTLFVKRFDKDTKQPLANRGWYVWSGQRQDSSRSDAGYSDYEFPAGQENVPF